MPLKRKLSKGASSSRNYDSVKFWNEEAENLYTVFLTRPILRERRIDNKHARVDGDDEVERQDNEIERRGWDEFVQTPPDAVVPVVREFYSNLKIRHENCKVLVRGKLVAFDAKTINDLYGLPCFDYDEHSSFLNEGVNYTDVLRRLCRDGAEWRMHNGHLVTFKKSDLQEEEKSWAEFVVAKFMPSSHATDITKDKAVLLHSIVTGKTIDVGKIMHNGILRVAMGPNSIALPFPHLITELCKNAGVTWESDEEILKARSPIVFPGAHRGFGAREIQQQDERQAFNARARERRLPPPPPVERLNLSQRLSLLENSLQDQRRDLAEHRHYSNTFMSHVLEFQAVLAQRFPPIGPEDVPFPQPPVWPPQYPPEIQVNQPMEEDDEFDGDDGDH